VGNANFFVFVDINQITNHTLLLQKRQAALDLWVFQSWLVACVWLTEIY
jgi:hypothetical protein